MKLECTATSDDLILQQINIQRAPFIQYTVKKLVFTGLFHFHPQRINKKRGSRDPSHSQRLHSQLKTESWASLFSAPASYLRSPEFDSGTQKPAILTEAFLEFHEFV
jgi:hypothetical protein